MEKVIKLEISKPIIIEKKTVGSKLITNNKPIIKKNKITNKKSEPKIVKQISIKQELNDFFRIEYQELPLKMKPNELYDYYNKTHENKVSYDRFLKAFPPWDLLVLS